MKRKKPYLLAGLVLLLFLLCTACGNTEGQIAPQDDCSATRFLRNSDRIIEKK